MNKSILILEENSIIHGLVASALDVEGLTLHHEFNPENYVETARSLIPDLILISNVDQQSDYTVCRELRHGDSLADVPLILLANSREQVDPAVMRELRVEGVVRKPFEASDLQQKVSKHLDFVDLLGSAFEYNKSQALDDAPNPLADLDVLEPEVMELLRQSDAPSAAAPPEQEMPGMDFDEELGGAASEILLDEEVLESTLQPDSAFEVVSGAPVEEGLEALAPEGIAAPGGAGEPPAEVAEGIEVELDAGAALEDEPLADGGLGAPEEDGEADLAREGATFPEPEAELDELGAADLLDEETPEETALQPSAIDEPLDEAPPPPPGDVVPLERIEVEFSDGGVDLTVDDEESAADELLIADELPAVEAPEETAPAEVAVEELEDLPLAEGLSAEEPLEELALPDLAAETPSEEPPEELAPEPPAPTLEQAAPAAGEPDLDLAGAEVDLSDDLDFTTLNQELADGEVGLFDAEARPEDSDGDEDIPPAVRRMMEMKPVFSLASDGAAEGADGADGLPADGLSLVSGDEELERVTEDLEPLGEISLQEEAIFGAEEASASEAGQQPPAVEAAGGGEAAEDDDEAFSEEILGDEELDEEKILEALEARAAEDAEDEEEPDDLEGLGVEDSDLKNLESMDGLEDLEPEEAPDDGEELVLDQDEEALMLAALEEEQSFEKSFDAGPADLGDSLADAAPAAAPPADQSSLDMPEEEALPIPERELSPTDVVPGDATYVVEEEFPPLEVLTDQDRTAPEEAGEAGELEASTPQEEGALDEGPAGSAEPPVADALLADSEPSLVDAMAEEGETAALDEDADADGDGDGDGEGALSGIATDSMELDADESFSFDEEDELALGESPDSIALDDTAAELELSDVEAELVIEPPAEAAEMDGGGGDEAQPPAAAEEMEFDEGDGADFLADLSSLKDEIAENPEGERLSDILAQEGIQAAVDDLEFAVPEEEGSFGRAMGVFELPGDEPAADAPPPPADSEGTSGSSALGEAVEEMIPAEGAAAGQTLEDRMIDSGVKARLGEVLDEIISVSVRKAVQEEMPKLMEKFIKNK